MEKTPTNRIKLLREARQWSMAHLGRQVGATGSTINKLEKGDMNLTHRWITRIAAALGVRPTALLIEPADTRIDPRLLSIALRIAEAVIEGSPAEVRNAVLSDYVAAAYDVLIEREYEGPIDEQFISEQIATNRREWLTRGE